MELWAGAGGEPAGHIPAAWPPVISALRACAAVLLTFLSLKTAQGRAVPDVWLDSDPLIGRELLLTTLATQLTG